jgi:hypothetical protein
MNRIAPADWKGIWALTWRSFVYIPIGVAIWTFLILRIVALVYLPILAFAYAILGLYSWAAGALALWLPVIWLGSRHCVVAFFFGPAEPGVEKCKHDMGMTV